MGSLHFFLLPILKLWLFEFCSAQFSFPDSISSLMPWLDNPITNQLLSGSNFLNPYTQQNPNAYNNKPTFLPTNPKPRTRQYTSPKTRSYTQGYQQPISNSGSVFSGQRSTQGRTQHQPAWRINRNPISVMTGDKNVNKEISDLVIQATKDISSGASTPFGSESIPFSSSRSVEDNTQIYPSSRPNKVHPRRISVRSGNPASHVISLPATVIQDDSPAHVKQSIRAHELKNRRQKLNDDNLELTVSRKKQATRGDRHMNTVKPVNHNTDFLTHARRIPTPGNVVMNDDTSLARSYEVVSPSGKYVYDSSEMTKQPGEGNWTWDADRNIFYQTRR